MYSSDSNLSNFTYTTDTESMDASNRRLKLIVDAYEIRSRYRQAISMYQTEEAFGRLVKFLGIFLFVVINLVEIYRGRFLLGELFDNAVFDNQILILTISASLYAYGSYLVRDKDKYQSVNHRSLYDLKVDLMDREKVKTAHLANYLNKAAISLLGDYIDDAEGESYNVVRLMQLLFIEEQNKPILMRLGLQERDLKLLVQKYSQAETRWNQQTFEKYLEESFSVALDSNFEYLDERALLIQLSRGYLLDSLQAFNISAETITAIGKWIGAQNYKRQLFENINNHKVLNLFTNVNAAMTSVYSPTVEKYTEDLTYLAGLDLKKGVKVKPRFQVTYRTAELDQIGQILNSDEGLCLVVGESGTGKTTLVETMVLESLAGMVPPGLKNKRILELNVTGILAQLEASNDMAGILQNIFAEQERSGDMILVIDDIDELLNLQPDIQQEVIGILAVELKKVQVKLLATITPSSYQRSFAQVNEIDSLFSKVNIEEADSEMSLQILLDELKYYEDKFKVQVEYQSLRRICELSPQYEFSKHMPDKALDILEEIMQIASDRGEKHINPEFVDEIVQQKVGLKLGVGGGQLDEEERLLLMNIESEIREYIVGQNEAVDEVSKALRRARIGLRKENKPVAGFLFYGPTGVGKTELSRTIAKVYFGDEKLLHRLDMSEFQSVGDLNRLLGSREGNDYIEGLLTQFVLQNPFCVILLDELEKAHPKVLDIFLQILDNAKVTDGAGRDVSFQNCIIVATSNAGSGMIDEAMRSGKSYKEIKPFAFEQIKKTFRIEFLNRFDAVVMFHPLTIVDAEKIVKMLLLNEKEKLKEKGIEFVFSDNLANQLIKDGFTREFGARSLKRKVTDLVENQVAEAMIQGTLKPGDIFSLE